MKKLLQILLLTLVAGCTEFKIYDVVPNQTKPITFGGSGTSGDPYTISTKEQLQLLATNVNGGTNYSGEYFRLTQSINLEGAEDDQWTPIGYYSGSWWGTNYSFDGTFDGGENTISGLYINSDSGTNSQALFGYSNYGTIKNLTVEGSVTSTGNYTAGVVGCGSATNCVNRATISGGAENTGGITGDGTVTNSFNEGKVSGASNVGGVTGGGGAYNCGNIGEVIGSDNRAGGIAGNGNNTISNCYNTGSVSGKNSVGGIVGDSGHNITNCYNTGAVSGSIGIGVGGVIGLFNGGDAALTNCYYNSQTSGASAGVGVVESGGTDTTEGKSTSEMQSTEFAALLNANAYAYNTSPNSATQACGWSAVSNGYPVLDFGATPPVAFGGSGTSGDPYTISTKEQLQLLATNVNSGTSYEGEYFLLTQSINLNGSDSDQWTPIGTTSAPFRGSFDGGEFTLSGVYRADFVHTDFESPTGDDYQGLFGYADAGSISNLSVGGYIMGYNYTGGIAGYAYSITNCHNYCEVIGHENIGGIVGRLSSNITISNCSNNGKVTGGKYVGGIVGRSDADVTSCFNTKDVSGGSIVGGIIGGEGRNITNCYNRGNIGYNNIIGDFTIYGGIGGWCNVANCYSTGSVPSRFSHVGGVAGDVDGNALNSYWLDTAYSGNGVGELMDRAGTDTTESKTAIEMTNGSFASTLGDAFKEDYAAPNQINGGYPILTWQ